MEKAFVIKVDMWTEPNKMGNMSRYYLKSFEGGVMKFGGISCPKVYERKRWAEKMAERIKREKFENTFDFNGSYEIKVETI